MMVRIVMDLICIIISEFEVPNGNENGQEHAGFL